MIACIAVGWVTVERSSAAEEGDDGADEIPRDSRTTSISAEELKSRYRVFAADAERLEFTPPQIPDLSGYTRAAAERRIDRSKPGTALIAPLLNEPGFKALTTAIGQGLRELALRQHGGLRAIIIEGGYVELSQLTRHLPKEFFEQSAPGVYIARLPILIRHGATLQIGPGTKQLRLSQERGSLLANEGALFVMGSEVIGWSELRRAP
ncbi:MAG: right-handed parallel beta-helix repeat-containing protein, partial [Gammaproteobacteria bacterium]